MCQTGDLEIYEGRPFGNIMMRSNITELERIGLRPGDSVDVHFGTGAVLEDIPFLRGCVLPEGMLCVNAYEGFDWVRIEKRFGQAWDLLGASQGDTVRIVLRERQKYASLYRIFNAEFSMKREDYPGDECFANYRRLGGGHIRRGSFYRSTASFDPLWNKSEFIVRQQCLDRLMERDEIQFVINMTCSSQQMEALFDSGIYEDYYVRRLYKGGKVFSDLFSVDFSGPVFQKQLAAALRILMMHSGPYLIQCKAGLDRTGFLCSLLEALVGTDTSEIMDDYMRSYECLFGLTRENDPEKYDILCRYQAERALNIIRQSGPDADLPGAAEKYLEQCGLTEREIAGLKELLTD